MASLAETENMNRVMYREWFPQIVYNHHQTGPQGTVMFAPPFRDPPNHNLDPIIITSLDQVGSAMHHRMVVEGKGRQRRWRPRRASYSTWWNGGLRTTPLLPQHDRPADRDHRTPHADRESPSFRTARSRTPTCRCR